MKPTNTYVFTFNSPILPTAIKVGFIQVKVDVYIQNPLRCYNCQVFGQHENKCGRHTVCCNCAQPEYCATGQCDKPAKCVNCSGDHPANSKQCSQWEKERQILKIKCEQNISFPEARKHYEQFNGPKTYASAVKPGTCNKSTQTENKSTQVDDTLESPYHLAAVSGAHFTQGTMLIVILVSSGSAKSRTHQSAVGGFLVTRRGWPVRLRACRIWTFINSV